MKIIQIAALSENNVIGKENQIPWHYPEDLKRFRNITMGHAVIMGRKTFESMHCKPLKGRRNIVLSSKDCLHLEDGSVVSKEDGLRELSECYPQLPVGKIPEIVLVSSFEEALSLCSDKSEVYVIGGSRVYEETMEQAQELRLTIIHLDLEGGDAFYPEIDDSVWKISNVEPGEEYSYVDYIRR